MPSVQRPLPSGHGVEQLGAKVHRRAARTFAVDLARAQERLQQLRRLAQLVVELLVHRDVEVRAAAAQAEVLALRRARLRTHVVYVLFATLYRTVEEARRARAGSARGGTVVGSIRARALQGGACYAARSQKQPASCRERGAAESAGFHDWRALLVSVTMRA